jgi:hypothetical protein
MKPYRKTAIIVGVLFLTATATYMVGSGFIDSSLNAPDYLINVSENITQVIIGVLLELICGAAVIGIGVMMFPILKKYNEPIALGYVGIRVIEAVIIVVRVISPLLLLTLSQEYVKADTPDASYFQTLGTIAIEWRYWTYQMILMTYLGGLMFSYLLYQSRLIPRFLSVLGLIGHPLVVTGSLLAMFGVIDTLRGVGMILMLPGGLFEFLLPIWLFVKGFNSSAIASQSTKQM